MTRQPHPESTNLELELGAPEVALKHLVSATGTFAGLINEVARSYLGAAREPVIWIVEVKPGSVKLPVRPQPATDAIRPSALPEMVTAIVEGLKLIESRPERPAYFTDTALQQAKALGNLASSERPVIVRNGREQAVLTKRVPANVDEVLGKPVASFGTVEGRLEAFNIHGPTPTFSVYDVLTGSPIACRLTERVTLEDLRPAIGRRVGVRGPLKRRPNGDPVTVEAWELRVFPSQGELPKPEDVLGILNGRV